jgi:hypothetical protein
VPIAAACHQPGRCASRRVCKHRADRLYHSELPSRRGACPDCLAGHRLSSHHPHGPWSRAYALYIYAGAGRDPGQRHHVDTARLYDLPSRLRRATSLGAYGHSLEATALR